MSDDTLYTIRDATGAIYGPANIVTLRQWIAEGRITADMQFALQGTQNFILVTQIPELAGAFPLARSAAASPPAYSQSYPPAQQATYQAPYYGKNNSMAVASLVCSLCGFMVCGVGGILGIVFGHIARSQIRREPDRYEGDGMATAGLILGYILVGLACLAVLAYAAFIAVMVSAAAHAPVRAPRIAPAPVMPAPPP